MFTYSIELGHLPINLLWSLFTLMQEICCYLNRNPALILNDAMQHRLVIQYNAARTFLQSQYRSKTNLEITIILIFLKIRNLRYNKI